MQMLTDTPRLSLGTLLTVTVLLVAAALLNFYHLDETEFFSHQPAQIAADARHMNANGQWLVPVVGDQVRTDVSPLYLWLTKISFWIGGEADPYRTRIPSAACSMLLMLLVAYWMRQQADRYGREDQTETPAEGFGLMAALVLAANPVLTEVGRDGTPSSLFTLLYAAAAYCWAESLEARRSYYAGRHWSTWLRWGYVIAGVTLLVKGPLVLLLLWLPYYFAARSYRLAKFNTEHLKGTLIALLLGCWWPLLVGLRHPEVAGQVWHDWLSFDLIEFDTVHIGIPGYFGRLALYTLPWLAPAVLMILRVHRREDRSPTLVFWSWALIATAPALALLGGESEWRLLPLAPWIALLATDGFHRWNFESRGSAIYRTLLRVWLVLAIAAGLFGSALLNSDAWLGLFMAVPLAWGLWTWLNARNEIVYTPWETTVRLASMSGVVLVMFYALMLAEYEPRRNYQHASAAYFTRVEDRLDEVKLPLYYVGRSLPGLYAFYLDKHPQIVGDLDSVRNAAPRGAVVLAERGLPELLAATDFKPLTLRQGADPRVAQAGMFLYMPALELTTQTVITTQTGATLVTATLTTVTQVADGLDTATLPSRLRPYPFHLAVLGNTGRRSPELRSVARRLDKVQRALDIEHGLLLGNNLWGPSIWNHLDSEEAFERPFRRVLRSGMVFHAALGHEDQAYGWLQTRYRPFHMFDRRYYSRELAGGLVEIFMLDSSALRKGDAQQIAWLREALANSRAPWRVVGMQWALASDALEGRPDERLAKLLLPILDDGQVNLVMWSGGLWYERLALEGHRPVFVNAGWSGDADRTRFRKGPQMVMAADREPGFVLLSFDPQLATYRAITRTGEVIDQFQLPVGGGAADARAALLLEPRISSEATTDSLQTTGTLTEGTPVVTSSKSEEIPVIDLQQEQREDEATAAQLDELARTTATLSSETLSAPFRDRDPFTTATLPVADAITTPTERGDGDAH